MYRIALCDDTERDLNRLEEQILSCREYDNTMEIAKYSSGIDFLESGNKAVDLLILDMQMNEIDGYETAQEFRRYNSEAVLAFCSAVCMPDAKHFEVQPYRYLLKHEAKKMERSIEELLKEMKRRGKRKRIEATADGKAIILDAEEILYLAKAKRGTRVQLAQNAVLYASMQNVAVREKLEDLQRELDEEGFARPNFSFLVNLKRVRAVDHMELLMENGERISVSRAYKETFHQAFSRYFYRKYRRNT